MEKRELVILAASHIAGGIAERAYNNERSSVSQKAAVEHIAELSVDIAMKIIDQAAKRLAG